MPALSFHIVAYVFSFIGMWYGSGLIVKSVVSLSHSFKIPRFVLSFFLLGLLTSLTEMMIGTLSVIEGRPEIFVGNLIGGVVVIFFALIPLLALAGNGVTVPKHFTSAKVFLTLFVIISPAIFTLTRTVFPQQGLFLLAMYGVLIFFLAKDDSVFEKVANSFKKKAANKSAHALKMVTGFGLLVISSHQIISSTVFFADAFHLSQFFVSLIVVSIGTNIPELSLVFRSVFEKKEDIALADYFGSASANTLLFGIFSILYGKPISLPDHVWQRFIFIFLGLILFFFFARSKKVLSRTEAAVLLGLYIGFILMEMTFAK